MSKPATFIEAFNAHRKDPSLIRFECTNDGEITFYNPEEKTSAKGAVSIESVVVAKTRQGISLRFIRELIADPEVNEIAFGGVSSYDMIDCFKHIGQKYGIRFVDHGGDFVWTRD